MSRIEGKNIFFAVLALSGTYAGGAPVVNALKNASNEQKPEVASQSSNRSSIPLTPVTREDLVKNLVQIATQTPLPPKPTEVIPTPTVKPTEIKQNPIIEIQANNEVTNIAWMPETVKQWSKLIVASGKKYNVPPELIASVILVESCGYQYAVSYSGAEGLGQIMPATGPDVDRFNVSVNIDFCASYLASMYKIFGDWTNAVTAYNWGPGNLRKWIDSNKNGTSMALGAQAAVYRESVMALYNQAHDKTSPRYDKYYIDHSSVVNKAEDFRVKVQGMRDQFLGNEYNNLDPKIKTVIDFMFEMKALGMKYKLGGMGLLPNGVNDCSGTIRDAYKRAGIIFSAGTNNDGWLGRNCTAIWKYNGRHLNEGEAIRTGDVLIINNASGGIDHAVLAVKLERSGDNKSLVFIHMNNTDGCIGFNSLDPKSPIYRASIATRIRGVVRIIE